VAGQVPVIVLRGVSKVYRMGTVSVTALTDVDLTVEAGEMVAVMGPSGSGKSTLMNLLGCLDRPTSGEYLLAGRPVARLGDDQLADVRNRLIGFVFQNYNLLPRLTALENVELPLIYRGLPAARRRQLALAALAAVGLSDRVRHLPAQLSGGQQQRVAIARALAGRPQVLLADEPTGNLDSRSGREILALMQGLNRAGVTLVVVTHDETVARHCRRVVRVFDGRIVADEPVPDGQRLWAAPPASATAETA
jgi:putative ABC transport system ATP-binding protein